MEESVRLLMEWGVGAVIVHRGARGCAAVSPAGWVEVPAVPVTRIVSETGRGSIPLHASLSPA